MPRRNLDHEWQQEHQIAPVEDRTVQWMGVELVRRDELPISAFTRVENAGPLDASGGDDARRFSTIIDAIRDCLEPDSHDAYDALISQPGIVGIERLMKLWEAIIEEDTRRPTTQPAPSSSGPQENGTPSTDGASTTEEWTSGALVPGASPTSPTPTSPPGISSVG